MSRNWLRSCSLTVGGTTVNGGGQTDLRIRWAIEQWHLQSPNMAHFRVYNPSPDTRSGLMAKEYTSVSFSAGYQDNTGLVFAGQVAQTIWGHEDNVVDAYVDIFAHDDAIDYNDSHVNKTLAAGHTPQDRLQAAIDTMPNTTLGMNTLDLSQPKYPRGFPMFAMARDVIRGVALSAGGLWSMQQGKVMLTPKTLDNTNGAIRMDSTTGLIGWPKQTVDGIWVRSLVNPQLQPLMNITLDPSSIIAAEKNNNPLDKSGIGTNQTLDQQALLAGTYTIFHMNRSGDSRGQEWYDESLCIGVGGDLSTSAKNSGYSLGTT